MSLLHPGKAYLLTFAWMDLGSCPNWGSFAQGETVFGTSAAVSVWDEAKGWAADSVGADEAENATPFCQDDS